MKARRSSPVILIDLTDGQRAALEPLFGMVNMAAAHNEDSALVAQVFKDAMRVAFVSGDHARSIHTAAGGGPMTYSELAKKDKQAKATP